MKLSRRWQFSVDLLDAAYDTADWTEVVRVCQGAPEGVVVARGEDGEQVEFEFNATHASILLATDDALLRPYFPGRSDAEQDISEFFCGECNLRVGNMARFLARSMGRAEAFRLCSILLNGGELPCELPEAGGEPVEWRNYPRPA